jgi:MoaA/NifB/PqqE/SkfB family radical SAM enzyme
MGYQCNVQCDYCTITSAMRGRNLTTAQIAKALEGGREAGLTDAAFGGGEPTMRKDLVKLVKLASGLGYQTIKISSNGLMYAYPEFVERLLSAGANQFNLALMGWNAGSYERIMGKTEYFDLAIRGVSNLVSCDAHIVGDIIMKHDTYQHLADSVEFWAEKGLEKFVFWLMSLTDRVKDDRHQLVDVTTMRPHMFKAFDIGRKRGIEVYSRHIPLCMLPGYHDHVWNVQTDKVLIVTPESSFWLSDSRITANTFIARCDDCQVKSRCMGIRRDYLDNVGDHEVEPVRA